MDGIYLVVEGNLKYSKTVNYQKPLEASTNNKWFKQQAQKIGIQNKSIEREVAYFTRAASVGIEELFRDYILSKQTN